MAAVIVMDNNIMSAANSIDPIPAPPLPWRGERSNCTPIDQNVYKLSAKCVIFACIKEYISKRDVRSKTVDDKDDNDSVEAIVVERTKGNEDGK